MKIKVLCLHLWLLIRLNHINLSLEKVKQKKQTIRGKLKRFVDGNVCLNYLFLGARPHLCSNLVSYDLRCTYCVTIANISYSSR